MKQMKQTKSIVWKLSAAIIGLFLGLFIIYTALTSFYSYHQTVKNTEEATVIRAQKVTGQLKEQFIKTSVLLETTAVLFESLHAEDLLTSEEILKATEANFMNNTQLFGLTVVLEEEAINSQNQTNLNLIDDKGRFSSVTFMDSNKIEVERAGNLDSEEESEWYQAPKKNKQVTLLDPKEIEINGIKTLVSTLSVPLISESGDF